MPQTSYVLGLNAFYKSFDAKALYNIYGNHYAKIDYDDVDQDTQQWKAPGYSKLDLNLSYDTSINSNIDMNLTANISNVFNKVYIDEAFNRDNASDGRVFMGMPRTADVKLGIRF